jgi:hypothetical protein
MMGLMPDFSNAHSKWPGRDLVLKHLPIISGNSGAYSCSKDRGRLKLFKNSEP